LKDGEKGAALYLAEYVNSNYREYVRLASKSTRLTLSIYLE